MSSSAQKSPITTCVFQSCDCYENQSPYLVKWMAVLTLFIVSCIGILSNLVAILTFLQPQMRQHATNALFVALTAADLLLLVMFIPLGIEFLSEFTPVSAPYVDEDISPCIACYFTYVSHTCSVWYCLAITVQRYKAICHPLTPAATNRKIGTIISAIAVTGVLFNIPRLLERTTLDAAIFTKSNQKTSIVDFDFTNGETKVPICSIGIVSLNASSGWTNDTAGTKIFLRNHAAYSVLYDFGLYCTLTVFIPFGTMFVLNFRVIRAIRRASNNRKRLTNEDNSHSGSMRMISVLTATFAICYCPLIVGKFLYHIRFASLHYRHSDMISDTSTVRLAANILDNVGAFMLTVNSAIPFFVYVSYGEHFRSTLKRLKLPFGSRSDNRFRLIPTTNSMDHGSLGHQSHSCNERTNLKRNQTLITKISSFSADV